MFFQIFKIFFFIFLLIYQGPLYSKKKNINEFNSKDLSNYFSAKVSYSNQKNIDALRFFNSSKSLLKKHDPYLKRYTFSLILEEKVSLAIKEIKPVENLFKKLCRLCNTALGFDVVPLENRTRPPCPLLLNFKINLFFSLC